MDTTRYTLIFVTILTVSAAILLTGLREATESKAVINEQIFNKRAILAAVEDHLDGKKLKELTDEEVISIFAEKVDQLVLDANGNPVENAEIKAESVDLAKERKKAEDQRKYPLFVYTAGDKKQFFIVSVRGNGLWDEIWGNIALEDDFNTIAGTSFDHKGETPGLGAEIKDNPWFPNQFKGKKIFTEKGEFVSVAVRKGGAKDPNHEVDAITGATITSEGVTKMLLNGIKKYEPYFTALKGK